MNYTIEHIAQRLKEARERKGLSQRALSKLAGVPQSHISKIENGGVDLRVSSLIELARVLDLELTLVPRTSVSAVRAVSQAAEPSREYFLDSGRSYEQLLKYLDKTSFKSKDLAKAKSLIRDLSRFRLHKGYWEQVEKTLRSLDKQDEAQMESYLKETVAELQRIRNDIAHGVDRDEAAPVRGAYSLEENGDG